VTAPTPPIPSFTDGTIVHQSDLNALGSNLTNLYNFCQGGFRTQRPFVIANQTVAQNIASGAGISLLSLNTTIVNTDNMWVPSQPTQLTVNTAGVYLVIAQVVWTNSFTGYRGIVLFVNGTTVPTNFISGQNYYDNGLVSGSQQVCVAAYRFAAGATIYPGCLQGSGITQPTDVVQSLNSSITAVYLSS